MERPSRRQVSDAQRQRAVLLAAISEKRMRKLGSGQRQHAPREITVLHSSEDEPAQGQAADVTDSTSEEETSSIEQEPQRPERVLQRIQKKTQTDAAAHSLARLSISQQAQTAGRPTDTYHPAGQPTPCSPIDDTSGVEDSATNASSSAGLVLGERGDFRLPERTYKLLYTHQVCAMHRCTTSSPSACGDITGMCMTKPSACMQVDAVRWLWSLWAMDRGGILGAGPSLLQAHACVRACPGALDSWCATCTADVCTVRHAGDDMGLGKTMETCAFLAGLLHSRLARRALVVAPKTLLAHWERELATCGLGNLTYEFYGSSQCDRCAADCAATCPTCPATLGCAYSACVLACFLWPPCPDQPSASFCVHAGTTRWALCCGVRACC